MRAGRHHGYAAKADDLERKGRRTFRQAGRRYRTDEDVYVCPAGAKLAYRYTTEENGLALCRYWTNANP